MLLDDWDREKRCSMVISPILVKLSSRDVLLLLDKDEQLNGRHFKYLERGFRD